MKLKKLWNLFSTLILGLIVITAAVMAGARLAGLKVFTVLSGSMEPAYPVGSLIYVKPTDPADIAVGDTITFVLNENGMTATHRVAEVRIDERGERRFVTKGDANASADAVPVNEKNVIGKPIITIPKLGYISLFLQEPKGIFTAISAGSMLILLLFLPEIVGALRREDKKPDKDRE